MRIITRLNIGGPAIHSLLLTREMCERQYQSVLVAGSCEAEDGDMSYLAKSGDPICWVPELSRSVRPWRNLKALWRLWRLLRRERPAIVHTHTAMAGCLGRIAAVLSGVPIIVHTFHGNSLSEYFSRFQAGLFRRIEQLLARFTDVLCVVSPQQARELSGRFQIAPSDKFRVVPLGLDLEDYFALRPPAASDALTVGWFGRMVPVKDVALLAATIEEILRLREDIRFVIAGDGPDSGVIEHLAAAHAGRVEWHGWQREILPVMARCDVLLQTSRNEGTPVALIQGMAAARPFVSTAVGGVIDMVSDANGILTDSSATVLADALITLADDRPRLERMGRAARSFAWRNYRKERLLEDVDSLYSELLQSAKGHAFSRRYAGEELRGNNSGAGRPVLRASKRRRKA